MRGKFAIFIIATSVLTGVDAFGYSVMNVCNGPDKSVEEFKRSHENYLLRDDLGQKRQKSLISWMERAPAEDVSRIWGEPELYEGREAWIVQWEASPRVSPELHYNDGNPCFYYIATHRRSYVFVKVEPGQELRKVYTVVRPHP